MGGIGKTQLVVEYVYRHRDDYPDGIFWIDAAAPLAEGFARLVTDHRLRLAENDQPRDEQMRTAFAALDCRPHALLVLDNLPDPAALAVSLSPGCTPEDLRCTVLFTTRRHDLGRFVGAEVTILPEESALLLLLRHPSRRAALAPSHSDHDHARAIARMLGRLPLALELAGAYLGKYSGDVLLEGYREGLKSDGVLATLDADATELTEADLRRMHDPAVAATIDEQWTLCHGTSPPGCCSASPACSPNRTRCRSLGWDCWRALTTRHGRGDARHYAAQLSTWMMLNWTNCWKQTNPASPIDP